MVLLSLGATVLLFRSAHNRVDRCDQSMQVHVHRSHFNLVLLTCIRVLVWDQSQLVKSSSLEFKKCVTCQN